MKITLYTAIKDGFAQDLHAEAMLRHHLDLADEIVVNEGFSSDETLERISRIDPKIKIFQSVWEKPKDLAWCIGFKDAARRASTGDWCIHLDCDEFIPEWEFAEIRQHLASTEDVLIPVRFLNFYGSYRVVHNDPLKVSWPDRKMVIHRNREDIEFWGDGSNVKLRDQPFTWETSRKMFTVHHFGMVRDPAILRKKWWIQGRAVQGKSSPIVPPNLLFRLFPHDWRDPQFFDELVEYPGPHIRAVQRDPNEFVRDKGRLVELIRKRHTASM